VLVFCIPAPIKVMASQTGKQARISAGVPAGGRFDVKKRNEADIVLDHYVNPELNGARTLIGSRAAIECAVLHAQSRNSKTPLRMLPWEDIAQEALTSVRTSVKNGRAEGFTPGLISAAVSQKVAAAINTKEQIRHEDAKATQMLREAVDIEQEMLGRTLTSREVIDLADRIRDTWENRRHRPQKQFYRRFIEISIDRVSENEILKTSIRAQAIQHVDERNSGSKLAYEVESGAVNKAEARVLAWNALADIWDVPRVSRTQTAQQAKTGQKVIQFNGGLSKVVNTYLADRVLTPEARAVFAPFGTPNDEGRQAIANELAARPSVAERLWRSAADGSIAPVPQWNEHAFS
jgi:hypothetical protein